LLLNKQVYWSLMEAYGRYGQREKTVEMFELARHESVPPYTSMIKYYGKWGEPEKAKKVFEALKDDLHTTGFSPGVTTYNVLTEAFAENNKFDEVFKILEITRKDKTKINEDTWNILIENGLKFDNSKALIDSTVRMKKLKGRCSGPLERKLQEYFKAKNIDFSMEQKKLYWTLWTDMKMYGT